MNTMMIREWAKGRGMACRMISFSRLAEVKARLEHMADEGALEPGFVRRSLSGFRYLEGRSVKEPRSLVLLALPRPAHIVTFHIDGQPSEYVLPPTYVSYTPTFETVRGWLWADLGLDAAQADLVHAPLKSPAAVAGLIRYGKNNIGYVPGMGSYLQLIGLAVSFPLDEDGEPLRIEDQMLENCRNCRACARACLTGAIGRDRFLLRAERCFTLLSESSDPIPETVSPPSTDCLIGCLKCQEVCPENKGLLKREHTGLVFDRRETECLLSDPAGRNLTLWNEMKEKFAALHATEGLGLMGRNMHFLLKRRNER